MEKFIPVILGSDENAYGTARLFRKAYDVMPLLVCVRELIPTYYSRIFRLKRIENFDSEDVFPDALDALLDELGKEYENIVVVPCSDYYSSMLIKNSKRFEGRISGKFISEDLLDRLDTKDKFYALCEKYGMDYPKTYVALPEDRIDAADKLPFDFPIVVKPENSNAYDYLHASFEGKKKVFFFDTKEEYLKVMESMNRSPYKGKLIIQEFIAGSDSAMRVMNSFSDGDGKVRAMCLGQPILEEYAPKTIGNYAAIISRSEENLYAKVKKFLEDIGYVGFSNIDMKYDAKNDRYVMFEINPRLGRSSFFVSGTGINMMKIMTDAFVFGKKDDCVFGNEETLWMNAPKKIIKEYIFDEKLKKEALGLIRNKKYFTTLKNREDRSMKRRLWIMRYYHGQHKNFKRYFFRKDIQAFGKEN